nr:replication associated protein [Flumine microvirus 22]
MWKHGDSEFGAVTFESAAYVARYVMKKITGDLAQPHYTYIDQHGEIHQRKPEYNQMSRGGRTGRGIGHTWIHKYMEHVYHRDSIITRGFESKPPRYYDNQLQQLDAQKLKQIKKARTAAIEKGDNTPKRLATKETVKRAQLQHLKRTLS